MFQEYCCQREYQQAQEAAEAAARLQQQQLETDRLQAQRIAVDRLAETNHLLDHLQRSLAETEL